MQIKLITNKFIRKVDGNANSMRFLVFTLGSIAANMKRNMSKYQTVLTDMKHLMDGLDALPSGLLLHTVILPGKLAELLDHVKRRMIEHFKEYELAIAEIHQYYDLPLGSYSYTDDVIVLQIPIYI